MNVKKIKHFIYLVEKERSGTPVHASRQLNVSERMLFNYINILKMDYKVPLDYNKHKQSYCYSEAGKLVWEWVSYENNSDE